ncbi:MAG: ABC transporter permease [Candidatus Rokubacteria bacterium]|nr:ABC transporter permease [Candidatus Rokubacteria bacterium]
MTTATVAIGAPARTRHRHALRAVPFTLLAGIAIVGLFALLAAVGPWVAPRDVESHSSARLQAPSSAYWFGTDRYGRDMFSRVVVGSRTTMTMAVSGTLLGVAVGLVIGLVSGYVGGRLDELLMRIMDIFMAFPSLLLALLVVAILGANVVNAMASIGIVFMPRVARVVRSATLGIRHAAFIEAAEVRGEPTPHIIFREILPNLWPPIIVEGSIRLSYAVLLSVSLSYLGLGAQPPTPDWGLMVSKERAFMVQAPWVVLFPAGAIVALVVGVNLLGDGLREWLMAWKSRDE